MRVWAVTLGCRKRHVDGIDLETNEIEVANPINGNREDLTFSNARITELESKYYDIVISNQVAEHVHNVGIIYPRLIEFLKRMGS